MTTNSKYTNDLLSVILNNPELKSYAISIYLDVTSSLTEIVPESLLYDFQRNLKRFFDHYRYAPFPWHFFDDESSRDALRGIDTRLVNWSQLTIELQKEFADIDFEGSRFPTFWTETTTKQCWKERVVLTQKHAAILSAVFRDEGCTTHEKRNLSPIIIGKKPHAVGYFNDEPPLF